MCVFFGPGGLTSAKATGAVPPLVVENTRIFARRAGEREQILAYQMALRAGDEVVMVLPLPVGSRDERLAVQFLNLEKCDELFIHLNYMLPVWVPPYTPPDDDAIEKFSMHELGARTPLAVQKVGSFEASFVPSIADFDRLDPRFRVAPELWAELGDYSDWGFAVFQLHDIAREKMTPVHPMAFRFITRYPESLFFPTVHIHDGSVHPAADFDHLLYFQSDSSARWEERWFVDGVEVADRGVSPASRTGRIRWSASERIGQDLLDRAGDPDAARIVIDPELPLQAFGMKGLLPNRDTWLHEEAAWR